MTYEQRISTISKWLSRYLGRKSTPRRLDTPEAAADEIGAIEKAVNRIVYSDANAEQLSGWLEGMGDRLDLQRHTSWPSIGEFVDAMRVCLPARKVEIEPEPESKGRAIANEWLRSPDGRDACLNGYHVAAAQWINNRQREPNPQEIDAIWAGADKVREEIVAVAQAASSGELARVIAQSAVAIEKRRIAVYERLKELHRLPDNPEWRAINVEFGAAP